MAADHIATEIIFKDGNNLTVEDMAKIMTKKTEVNVNTRAYDYILELVARNPNKFFPNENGDYQSEVWGKVADDKIFIIKSVFDRELQSAGFNSTAFLAWAKRMELLATAKDRRTISARIGGTVTTCVCIIKTADKLMEEVQEEIPF